MASETKAERLRATLWFWPVVTAVGAFALALLLLLIRPPSDSPWSGVLWPGDRDLAVTLLQIVATSAMTATTLTFSLTVVALQLASQQFSPRLLREFARDPRTQVVLGLLVSTFVIALTGLAGLVPDLPLPSLVLALVFLLGIASILGLLTFLGHLVRSLRIDTMMATVHQKTLQTIDETYGDIGSEPPVISEWDEAASIISAEKSGIVRMVRGEDLVGPAAIASAIITVVVRPGDHVIAGSPVALVSGRGTDESAAELEQPVRDVIDIGYERTTEQDSALGFRQLTDIAVKAISPGINDPTTASHAMAFCADLLVHIQGKRLGPKEHRDPDGTVRVVTWDRNYGYYIDLVCSPVRRFGRGEPIVLVAILRLLRDCAAGVKTDEQREEVVRQVALVEETVDRHLVASDRDVVSGMADRVRAALAGRWRDAYQDEAGETRSV